VQKRHADRNFLEKALEVGKAVYSLHKNPHKDVKFVKKLKASGSNIIPVSPPPFLKNFIEEHGGKIKAVYAMLMTIPHMFNFHKKRKHVFVVDLYVIGGK
jgi:putative methylase